MREFSDDVLPPGGAGDPQPVFDSALVGGVLTSRVGWKGCFVTGRVVRTQEVPREVKTIRVFYPIRAE